MTADTKVLAGLELEMFEGRNVARQELLDADTEMLAALAAFPPDEAHDAVLAGLEAWEMWFSVLERVAAVGNAPRGNAAYRMCEKAGAAVDQAVCRLPAGDDREALRFAIGEWVEAYRTCASYRHIPPRAWWKND